MPPHPDAAAHAALLRWGVRVRAVSTSALGTMNETFIVTTDTERVVLRRHRRCNPAVIRHEHEIIAHAAARGVPTPPAIRTPDGELVVESDGRFYSLFAHAPGTQIARGTLGAGHARAMGVALAQLHDALADYPIKRFPASTRPPPPNVGDTVAALEELRQIVTAWPDAGEQEEWAARRLSSRLEWIDAHRDQLGPPAGSPTVQSTHGDYQEANLFFDGEPAVTAVIDWDKAEPADPARELIRAMALSFGLDPTLCAEFVRAYRSRQAMPLEALDAAADAYGHDRIHDTWLYDAIYRHRDDRPRAFLRPGDFHPFADRWLATRAALQDRLAGLR